jgi:hypothetical protein
MKENVQKIMKDLNLRIEYFYKMSEEYDEDSEKAIWNRKVAAELRLVYRELEIILSKEE